MFEIDSLVIDLIFKAGATPSPEDLIEGLGGEEIARTRKLFDPDTVDPRVEMQLSPTVPFRKRDERRLMIIDDSVAPMRKDPRTEPVVPVDLRPEKDRLLALMDKLDVRLGRIMALGSWGDAVVVAHSARDLRAIALVSWALDPFVDADGNRRSQQLTPQDFEAKVLAYEKRLEELDEQAILANTGAARFERRDELLVLDMLSDDGTWDVRTSLAVEDSMAAVKQFSTFPGAPAAAGQPAAEPEAAAAPAPAKPAAEPEPPAAPEPAAAPAGPPVRASEYGDDVVLVFPPERWDLDIASAIGTKRWEEVLAPTDGIPGATRDRIYERGAGFLAPLEFLSEVFVDGKPLSKPDFEANAKDAGGGVRTMPVHCPRFGSALLIDTGDRGRFITSKTNAGPDILDLLS